MKNVHRKDAHLEKHKISHLCARVFVVPLLNHVIPASKIRAALVKSSQAGKDAVERSGSSHAMESFYARDKGHTLMEKIGGYITHQVISPTKATRNRLLIVEEILEKEFIAHNLAGSAVSCVTLGGGTAHSLISVLARLTEERVCPKVTITNIDLDKTALERGAALAQSAGCGDMFTWINDDVFHLDKHVASGSADIIEMIGLLDYLSDTEAIALLYAARKALKPKGLLVLANIRPSKEEPFFRKAGWPKMYHRTEHDLGRLLREAKFDDNCIETMIEPVKLHTVARVKHPH